LSEPTNLVVYEAIYEEMYDSMERAATTATSLDAEQFLLLLQVNAAKQKLTAAAAS
ncbi:hypothetical protein Tco_0701691, partial [Tanacetum coccineum]